MFIPLFSPHSALSERALWVVATQVGGFVAWAGALAWLLKIRSRLSVPTILLVLAFVGACGLLGGRAWWSVLATLRAEASSFRIHGRLPTEGLSGGTASWGVVGGFVAGGVGAGWALGVPVGAMLDGVLPATSVGFAFARVGCQRAGCEFGRVAPLWAGIRYGSGTIPWSSMMAAGKVGGGYTRTPPIWPVAMMEIVGDLALLLGLAVLERKRRRPIGWWGTYWALAYGLLRFAIEPFRAVPPGEMMGPLSANAWVSMACAAVGATWLLYPYPRTRPSGETET